MTPTETPRLLAFAGSARQDSCNKKLVRIAAASARAAGAEVTEIDLADYPMPIYDGDLEAREGLPESARRLKALMREQDGYLLACPEYNSSITPLLKNTIDWTSRPESDDEPSLVCYRNKVVGLLSASPGALGGMRGLVHVRAILGNIGALVVPVTYSLSSAYQAFGDDGQLADASQQERVDAVGRAVADTARRMKD